MCEKNTFVFNVRWYDVLKTFPAETRLEVIEAIMCYASTGEVPELGPVAYAAFAFIKMEMDYNTERYNAVVERRRAAGRKGAMVANAKYNPAKAANAGIAEQNRQSSANVGHNDNDNDNVNDNDSKIEKEKIEKEIFESGDCACGAASVEFVYPEAKLEGNRPKCDGHRRAASSPAGSDMVRLQRTLFSGSTFARLSG